MYSYTCYLDLCTIWRWVVSFTPLPLNPRHPLDRRFRGPPIAGLDDMEKWKLSNSDPTVVQSVGSRYTDYATAAHHRWEDNIKTVNIDIDRLSASLVKWSEFLVTDPEVQVLFPALPNFLRSIRSGTGSTQHHEYNWGATWKNKKRLRFRKPRLLPQGIRRADYATPSISAKVGTNFAYKWRSLGRYSSLAD
jgi:hypothetical protein